MFFPVVIDGSVLLCPVSWDHVLSAFAAMQGTTTRPSPMTASSVHLDAAGKMSVSKLEAVACTRNVEYMTLLWEQDKLLADDDPRRVYRSCPLGTIAMLSSLSELLVVFRWTTGGFTFKTADDARLTRATQILGEFRVVTQLLAEVWDQRQEWLLRTNIRYLRQTFLSPESMHALDSVISGFKGVLRQLAACAPDEMRRRGITCPTTGRHITTF